MRPLFADRPVLVVVNKVDIAPLADASPADRAAVLAMAAATRSEPLAMSAAVGTGVADVKTAACRALLEWRAAHAPAGPGPTARLHVAMPPRKVPLAVPASVLAARAAVEAGEAPPRPAVLEKDLEEAGGGPGVYVPDLRGKWMLEDPEWRYDAIPEIVDGMNVADYVRPDIAARLAELEAEEEAMLAAEAEEDEAFAAETASASLPQGGRRAALAARAACKLAKIESALKRSLSHHRGVSGEMRARSAAFSAKVGDGRVRSHSRAASAAPEEREIADRRTASVRSVSRRNTPTPASRGMPSAEAVTRAEMLHRVRSRAATREGRHGIYDRHVYNEKPKHLNSGKMDFKRDRR